MSAILKSDEWSLSSAIFMSDEWTPEGWNLFRAGNCGWELLPVLEEKKPYDEKVISAAVRFLSRLMYELKRQGYFYFSCKHGVDEVNKSMATDMSH